MMLELDGYERDNLLALLAAASGQYGQSALSRAGHSGDWTMQVLHKLGWCGERTDWGHPNRTAAEMVETARRYHIQEERELDD